MGVNSMSKTASQICFDAADLIEKHGWIRGALQGPRGALCIHGAMNKAAYGNARGSSRDARYSPAPSIAVDAVFELTRPFYISEYNDDIAKDRRYVTRKLRRAGRNLEAVELTAKADSQVPGR